VEEEKESVDGDFQESEIIDEEFSEIIDEEFEHECVEDENPLKGFVDCILHQPMTKTSMRKIQLKNLWHPT
jgi:hypothetical protein